MPKISIRELRQYVTFREDALDPYWSPIERNWSASRAYKCLDLLRTKNSIIRQLHPYGSGYREEYHRRQEEISELREYLIQRITSLHKFKNWDELSAFKILFDKSELAFKFLPFGRRKK